MAQASRRKTAGKRKAKTAASETQSPSPGAEGVRADRSDGPDRLSPLQKRFLAAVGQSANITQAAELAGVDRSSHYHWLQAPHYRRAFLEARESALDRLELEAWKRAIAGSDRLLVFLLSSYRARFQPGYQAPGPVLHELAQMDDQELLAEAQRELRQLGYESLEELWQKE